MGGHLADFYKIFLKILSLKNFLYAKKGNAPRIFNLGNLIALTLKAFSFFFTIITFLSSPTNDYI